LNSFEENVNKIRAGLIFKNVELLTYMLTEPFVLPSKQPDGIRMIDLGDAEYIDRMIVNFRVSISKDDDDRRNQGSGSRNLVTLASGKGSQNLDYDPTWKVIGYELYKSVFEPLSPAIRDSKRLFIAPDGELTRLPFEVLPTEKGGREVLIDKYFISYLTTARDNLRIGKIYSNEHSNEALVVADPDFDLGTDESNNTNLSQTSNTSIINNDSGVTEEDRKPASRHSRDIKCSGLHFDRLTGTKKEGNEISKLLNVSPLMAERVLESRLKSYISPKILHIATHGFFLSDQGYAPKGKDISFTEIGITKDDSDSRIYTRLSGRNLENPMLRSGLALAGANTWLENKRLPVEAEDGILTAEDVSGMDLSNTELVVLSACETGLGDILTGEGVFGLRRSFVLAGAQTLLMSLWKVPDEQTKELMIDFYKRLLSGKPRAGALREAQLAIRERYSDPYYWGAFICQGNPDPLMLNKN
jgi:CHAT domain-containing protein